MKYNYTTQWHEKHNQSNDYPYEFNYFSHIIINVDLKQKLPLRLSNDNLI